MSDGDLGAALRLECQPTKTGNLLVFAYTLDNPGPRDVLAMYALPSTDPGTGEARADSAAAVVIAAEGGDAIVGQFAAPPPVDRQMALPVFPLARRLPAGGHLEGRIEVPLPLAETSPYFPDLTLRQYDIVELRAVVFTIGYWLDGADGMSAEPAAYASDLFVVATRDTLRSVRRVSRRFPTSGLQLFRRRDAFPRVLG